ncbi:MAG: hypothetical protein Q9207_008561 [Kuettlingeria erythrocarpa]
MSDLSQKALTVGAAGHRAPARLGGFSRCDVAPGLAAFDDDDYQTVRFHGSFGLPSPYKGPPNPDVDAKWSEIENIGAISITEDEFRRLNASKHAVKVPLDLGGGYMALPEFVHQIHCVVSPPTKDALAVP